MEMKKLIRPTVKIINKFNKNEQNEQIMNILNKNG